MANTSGDFSSGKRQIDIDCKTGAFRSCYLLYGPEEYLIRQTLSSLKRAVLPDDNGMNLLIRRDEAIDVEEALSFAQTMPFFAKRRLVVLEDANRFHKSAKELSELVATPMETAVIVLVARGFSDKKQTKEFTQSALCKACGRTGRVLLCDLQEKETLKKWVVKRLGVDHGRIFKENVIDHFLDRMNGHMGHIDTELHKLVSYTEGRTEITVKDIDAICAPWPEGRIFDLTDALANRNREKAMAHYMTLLEMDETPAGILYRIADQMRNILMVSEMMRANYGREAMIASLKLPPQRAWTINHYTKWTRYFKDNELRSILELILTNDRAIKRSLLDKSIAVEMIIARCTT